jgi:hypothetical protein
LANSFTWANTAEGGNPGRSLDLEFRRLQGDDDDKPDDQDRQYKQEFLEHGDSFEFGGKDQRGFDSLLIFRDSSPTKFNDLPPVHGRTR